MGFSLLSIPSQYFGVVAYCSFCSCCCCYFLYMCVVNARNPSAILLLLFFISIRVYVLCCNEFLSTCFFFKNRIQQRGHERRPNFKPIRLHKQTHIHTQLQLEIEQKWISFDNKNKNNYNNNNKREKNNKI